MCSDGHVTLYTPTILTLVLLFNEENVANLVKLKHVGKVQRLNRYCYSMSLLSLLLFMAYVITSMVKDKKEV